MKVNMTPNPLDVVTIHASQGDTEARQWEFELHNNGELIDTSDVKEQLVFKAYKGGTEQILPENTSTPTTSPFKGDIKYPQGLLSDQEFLYRESPTESDGLAKITDIKGNTLVWNQQINSSLYVTGTYSNVAVTKSTDKTYLIANGTASAAAYIRLFTSLSFPMISGHKYLCVVPNDSDVAYYDDTSPRQYNNKYSSFIFTSNGSPIRPYARINSGVTSTNRRISFMMFDITQMGLDSLTVEEFTSLFPLPYYSYNQGSLLSFNGNGIKTVGKNLLNPSFTTIDAYINSSGVITASSNDKSVIVPLLPNLSYVFTWNRGEIISSVADDTQVGLYNEYPSIGMRGTLVGNTSVSGGNIRFNSASNRYAVIKISNITRTDFDSTIIGSQLEFGSSATDYEPYTSSTLSLPISTYFPNGMKSAGNVYDELTESKAITRIGAIDLGSLSWTKETRQNRFNSRALTDAKTVPSDSVANGVCAKYITIAADDTYFGNDGLSIDSGGRVNIYDSAYASATASDFKTSMSGIYLYYELATPTETSFTTASLVTENAEIPLSNNDGVLIGRCTEQLSAEPGFHDAKIKLSDSDGECYSNKIQLHIERSPQ